MSFSSVFVLLFVGWIIWFVYILCKYNDTCREYKKRRSFAEAEDILKRKFGYHIDVQIKEDGSFVIFVGGRRIGTGEIIIDENNNFLSIIKLEFRGVRFVYIDGYIYDGRENRYSPKRSGGLSMTDGPSRRNNIPPTFLPPYGNRSYGYNPHYED